VTATTVVANQPDLQSCPEGRTAPTPQQVMQIFASLHQPHCNANWLHTLSPYI
jgi:hypothetical protein